MPPDPIDHNALDREAAIRARQRSRAIVVAVLLFAFVVLVYAISIVKMIR